MDSVFKKYIPVKSNNSNSNINHIKLEVYYSLGGMNYFTYRNEDRGYYVSVTPVERVNHGDYFTESVLLGSGVKKLIKPVYRKSDKAADDAVTVSKNYWHDLIMYVCDDDNLEVIGDAV